MANLVIDIGNTYTKIAVFDNNVLVYINSWVSNTATLVYELPISITKLAIKLLLMII